MSESGFEDEIRDLFETCVHLQEQLNMLQQRIERLEALGDSSKTAPRAIEPPPIPQAIPVTPTSEDQLPPPAEPSDTSRDVYIADLASFVPAPDKPKDIGAFVHRLMHRESERPHRGGVSKPPQEQGPPRDEGADARSGMELRIGGTWLNRAGAIIIFLAMAFFAKYSFDQGWISPTMRVVLAGAVGLSMVVLGEYSLFRGMRTFAGGLLGGGVCILYLAVYGAHGFYELINPETAFVLYVGVTALSVVISVHARILAVAILGVIGAYATPIVLSTGENRMVALLVYILAVDIGFLLSASIRRWDVLRVLLWLGTLGLFSAWYLEFYDQTAMWLTAGFVLVFYLLFHTEAILCLRRGATQSPRLIGYIVHANNIAFFGSIYFLLRSAIPQWMGLFAVASAGLQWITAWRLCGRSVIADRARRSLWLDGAAMLALAAPMQFDRYMVSVSWAVQGVVTLWFCRRVERIWLRVKGTGVLLASIGHLLIFDYSDESLAQVLFTIGQWHLSWMIVCFVCVGLCAHAAAATLSVHRDAPHTDRMLSGTLVVFGTILMLGIFADQWERYVASWWWLGLATAWWALALRAPFARVMAVALMLTAFGKFVFWDTGGAAVQGFWETIEGLALNRAVVTGALVAVLGGLVRRMADQWPERIREVVGINAPGPIVTLAILLVITWTGTFEVLRAFQFDPYVTAHFEQPAYVQGVFITAFWALNASVLWLLADARRPYLSGYVLALSSLAILNMMLFNTLASAGAGRWSELTGICTNSTFLVGLLVIGMGLLAYRRYRDLTASEPSKLFAPEIVTGLLVIVTLLITWMPTFEICRAFRFEDFRHRFADPRLAMHVALSAFWSLNATALLILGFLRRAPVLRYMALGLYAVTVGKVFLFDLGHLEMIYRVISFMVLGVLLLFASLLYQRLSSRLTVAPSDAPVNLE